MKINSEEKLGILGYIKIYIVQCGLQTHELNFYRSACRALAKRRNGTKIWQKGTRAFILNAKMLFMLIIAHWLGDDFRASFRKRSLNRVYCMIN